MAWNLYDPGQGHAKDPADTKGRDFMGRGRNVVPNHAGLVASITTFDGEWRQLDLSNYVGGNATAVFLSIQIGAGSSILGEEIYVAFSVCAVGDHNTSKIVYTYNRTLEALVHMQNMALLKLNAEKQISYMGTKSVFTTIPVAHIRVLGYCVE